MSIDSEESSSTALSTSSSSTHTSCLPKSLRRRSLWSITAVVVLIPTILSTWFARRMAKSKILGEMAVSTVARSRLRDDYVHRFIQFRIEIAQLSSMHSLLESDSPQTRALEWLVFRDETLLNEVSAELAPRYALLVLFYACAGAVWGHTASLEQNEMVPFSERTQMENCEWTDLVECDAKGRITVLKGGGFGMIGELPEEIAILTDLTALRLPTNSIEGTIPTVLFSGLSKLEVLDISNNRLVGTIPTEIGLLTSLVALDIGSNNFRGTFPGEMRALSLMEQFSVQDLRISGPLLEFAARHWSNLRSISLVSTELNGPFSMNADWKSTLEYLNVQNNLLTGALPSTLENMTSLTAFKIGSNGLTGSMFDLGQMRQLGNLLLKETLTGTIPTSIGRLTALRELEIAHLSGTIPTELGNCIYLQRLRIIDTAITGTIPSTIGRLSSLQMFAIENSPDLVGSIPSEVCYLSQAAVSRIRYPCNVECDCCNSRCAA